VTRRDRVDTVRCRDGLREEGNDRCRRDMLTGIYLVVTGNRIFLRGRTGIGLLLDDRDKAITIL
jgi:hypothetical protein